MRMSNKSESAEAVKIRSELFNFIRKQFVRYNSIVSAEERERERERRTSLFKSSESNNCFILDLVKNDFSSCPALSLVRPVIRARALPVSFFQFSLSSRSVGALKGALQIRDRRILFSLFDFFSDSVPFHSITFAFSRRFECKTPDNNFP